MIQWLPQPWVTAKRTPQVPNVDNRKGYSIDSIFLHYTAGGPLRGTLDWFQNPAAKCSAHFIVGRNGEVVQCVPLGLRAWHAGIGEYFIDGRMDSSYPDKVAVGIEMCNYGLVHRDHNGRFYYEAGNQLLDYDLRVYPTPVEAELNFYGYGVKARGYWEPYPEVQIGAVTVLCAALMRAFDIKIDRIVGHEDVALYIGRKTDPGPLFPWKQLVSDLQKQEFTTNPGASPFQYHRTVRT